MIGYDQHIGVVVEQLEQGANLLVDVRIIISNQIFVWIAGYVLAVQRVVILPKTVMDTVNADFDELKVIPFHAGHEVADHLEVLPRHVIDLVTQPVFVIGTKAFDIDRVFSYQTVDLLPDAGRISVIVGRGVGRHKAPDIHAVHAPWRKTGRHAHHHYALMLSSQDIPDRGLLNGSGIDDREAVIGIILAVTKSVNAQRSRILAGRHAHPCGYRDRRDDALQPAITAALHQPPNVA